MATTAVGTYDAVLDTLIVEPRDQPIMIFTHNPNQYPTDDVHRNVRLFYFPTCAELDMRLEPALELWNRAHSQKRASLAF